MSQNNGFYDVRRSVMHFQIGGGEVRTTVPMDVNDVVQVWNDFGGADTLCAGGRGFGPTIMTGSDDAKIGKVVARQLRVKLHASLETFEVAVEQAKRASAEREAEDDVIWSRRSA